MQKGAVSAPRIFLAYDSVFGGDDRSADADELVASHAGSGVHEEPAPLQVFFAEGRKARGCPPCTKCG